MRVNNLILINIQLTFATVFRHDFMQKNECSGAVEKEWCSSFALKTTCFRFIRNFCVFELTALAGNEKYCSDRPKHTNRKNLEDRLVSSLPGCVVQ